MCKFAPSCKFDRPLGRSYSPSASSLGDMPVAPYPVVSSMSTANGPVGSMFSKGDPVSHSGVQQSCTSSSVSRSTGHLDPNFGASPCYDAFVLVILVLPFTSTTQ
ncbi:hypothetical protein P3S67_010541 [Capsicum chacoense]